MEQTPMKTQTYFIQIVIGVSFFSVLLLGTAFLFFGDRIFFWQGDYMAGLGYDFPAYEAYERVTVYFPHSVLASKAARIMVSLVSRNPDLARYLRIRTAPVRPSPPVGTASGAKGLP
jgi:hypothetical protein